MKRRAAAHVIGGSIACLLGWVVYVFSPSGCGWASTSIHDAWICLGTKNGPFNRFSDFYSADLRGNLFAGYLTLGGFLLSLKTFIIVTMNDKLYENPEYRKKWKEAKSATPTIGSLYTPLRRLNDLLFYAIAASLVAAGAQFTLGFLNHWITATICISTALWSFSLVVDSLFLIKANLDTWLTYIDQA